MEVLSVNLSSTERSPLLALPALPLINTLSYLDVSDLCRFSQANRACYALSLDRALWREIFTRCRQTIPDTMSAYERQMFIQSQTTLAAARFHEYIASQPVVTDSTIDEALRLSPPFFLRHVCIEVPPHHCSFLTDRALDAISQANPNILSFGLCTIGVQQFSKISADGITRFQSKEKKLQSLTLQGCTAISSEGYKAIAMQSPALLDVLFQSNVLTDYVVELLVSFHPHLRSIGLVGNSPHITDKTLKALGHGCRDLQKLTLQMYTNPFSTEKTKKFFTKMGNLQDLSFHGSLKVSNTCIHILCQYMPHLRSLYLANCSKVNKSALRELGRHYPALNTLYLEGCSKPQKLATEFQKIRSFCFPWLQYFTFS